MVDANGPLTSDWLATGDWEVDVAGQRIPAVTSLRPMYDPDNARIRS
jgi:4-methylaminobutanoate oxidase (formaldehyde-forming)